MTLAPSLKCTSVIMVSSRALIATLAIGVTVPPGSTYSTVDLHVQFLDALRDEDAVAEGWVVRQGRRTVFGESEARAATSGRLVAKAVLTYSVRVPVIIA